MQEALLALLHSCNGSPCRTASAATAAAIDFAEVDTPLPQIYSAGALITSTAPTLCPLPLLPLQTALNGTRDTHMSKGLPSPSKPPAH